jgi:hypothetical protein
MFGWQAIAQWHGAERRQSALAGIFFVKMARTWSARLAASYSAVAKRCERQLIYPPTRIQTLLLVSN